MFWEIRPVEKVGLGDKNIETLTHLMVLCTDWESLYSEKSPEEIISGAIYCS
jgi:hypothetical protein